MKTETATRLMQWSLRGLALYFILIALAHISGTKVPLLFVYFDVPSNIYQDNIISFLAFGWSAFLFTMARNPLANLAFVRVFLLGVVGALAGLSYTNMTTNFSNFAPELEVWPYWAQTGMLAVIGLWVLWLYIALKRNSNPQAE